MAYTLQLFGRVEGIQEREFLSGSSAISSTPSSTKTIGCALVAFFIRSYQWKYCEKSKSFTKSSPAEISQLGQDLREQSQRWHGMIDILRQRHLLMVTWYWGYSTFADRGTGSDSAQSWILGWSRKGGEPTVAWHLNKLFEEFSSSCNEAALEVSMYVPGEHHSDCSRWQAWDSSAVFPEPPLPKTNKGVLQDSLVK